MPIALRPSPAGLLANASHRSSPALRATPPSAFVSSAVTVILFVVPLIGVALETPLFEVMGKSLGVLMHVVRKIFPNLNPPELKQATVQVKENASVQV